MTGSFKGVMYDTICEMVGNYPDVRLAEGVDLAMLTEGDGSPMFVTLPVMPVGVLSRNGIRYPRAAVEKIRDTILRGGVAAIRGHLPESQRGYANPPQVARWVGAVIVDEMLWGKAYIFASAPELREEVRTAKATNGRVGTSIYGTGEVSTSGEATNIYLETIDFVNPDRVGVPQAAAMPMITAETFTPNITQEGLTMPTEGTATVISEQDIQVRITEALKVDRAKIAEMSDQLNVANRKLADYEPLLSALGNPSYPAQRLTELLGERDALLTENAALLDGYIASKVGEFVAAEAVRPLIANMVKEMKPATRNAVDAYVGQIRVRADVQALLKATLVAEMGPALNTNGQKPADAAPQSARQLGPIIGMWGN